VCALSGRFVTVETRKEELKPNPQLTEVQEIASIDLSGVVAQAEVARDADV
jgi:hypothetical protein